MSQICVIIRTLNPHRPTLARVLEGLRRQTFPLAQTELLIVDNASEPPLDAAALGLDWHPRAQVVREPIRGKIMAQRTGICAASAECDLLLLVDDDNVLRADYLETGARLAGEFAQLGAWGSGSIRLEFEQPPPAAVGNLTRVLTTWEYPYAAWSSLRDLRAYSVPAGAGMFVRRNVAQRWVEILDGSPMRRALWLNEDPPILFSEDTDLALTAPDMGLGTGIFPALHIDHLVRAGKVTPERLLRLIENQQCAEMIIQAVRGLNWRGRFQSWRKAVNDYAKLLFQRGIDRRAHWHLLRGQVLGRRLVRDYLAAHPGERPPRTRQPWDG
jgi:hypothetical protein